MIKNILNIFHKNNVSTNFNIDTYHVVKFFENRDILLHNYDNNKFDKELIKKINLILGNGVKIGKSYTQIAKELQNINPNLINNELSILIAVNETGVAYGYANYIPACEMQKQGYTIEKKWNTVKDELVRCECKKNEEIGWIPLGEKFSGTGDFYAPSQNILNCRCAFVTRITG